MAQAGIHGLAGMAVRKLAPQKEWLMLGIVLGNILPDADNLAVAAATIIGRSTEGLHRTFTHNLFFVLGLILVGYVAARVLHQPRLGNLGLGLGIGAAMHITLDLLIWFNGVEILWPIPSWVNFWSAVAVPEWFAKLLMPMEFLFLGLFLWMILVRAQKLGTDTAMIRGGRIGASVLFALFVVFLVLVYTLERGFLVPYGAVYLLSLAWVAVLVIRMRETVDSGPRLREKGRDIISHE